MILAGMLPAGSIPAEIIPAPAGMIPAGMIAAAMIPVAMIPAAMIPAAMILAAMPRLSRQIRTKIYICQIFGSNLPPLKQWGVSGSEDLLRIDTSHHSGGNDSGRNHSTRNDAGRNDSALRISKVNSLKDCTVFEGIPLY